MGYNPEKLEKHFVIDRSNDEHRALFEESAEKAADMGRDTVVDDLKGATERAKEVSIHLRRALEEFK